MPTKIIAELSANHNHDLQIAKNSILAAKECGADAIKLQTYTPDTLTLDCDNSHFQLTQGTIWDGISLYQLYQQAYTPWEWHEELFAYAHKVGIEIFSTPFDKTAVDLLEDLNNPIYKVASFEITDIALLKYIASKHKPLIISTGIATLAEIEDAVQACSQAGNNDITLLQCTSQYPASYQDACLANMAALKDKFGVKVGLSDHTAGHYVSCLAVAMGAEIIEKHFIIDKSIGGPDASFSLTANEFKELVQKVREVEHIIAKPNFDLTPAKQQARVFARSLFVVKDMRAGQVFSEDNIRSIRPGSGLAPKYLEQVLNKRALTDIERGTPLSWELIEE